MQDRRHCGPPFATSDCPLSLVFFFWVWTVILFYFVSIHFASFCFVFFHFVLCCWRCLIRFGFIRFVCFISFRFMPFHFACSFCFVLFCFVLRPKILQTSKNIIPKYFENHSQNEPKSIQSHPQKGIQTGSSKICAFFCHLYCASWAHPGRLWRRLGCQKHSKLEAKTYEKSMSKIM